MRFIPAALDADVVSAIDVRLDGVCGDYDVSIPWAIESGSRAWGFPSPDSDYDCRFVYVRSVDSYLTPWPIRDVIETPLDAVFDVGGWDVVKAIRLLAKGNVTPVEWLRSPIIYKGDPEFRDAMLDLAESVADRHRTVAHYLSLGAGPWLRAGRGVEPMKLKKAFYSLRPAAALRWLRTHPSDAVPPMALGELLAGSDPAAELLEVVGELVALKAKTREMGVAIVPRPIAQFIDEELALAEETVAAGSRDHAGDEDRKALAADRFREIAKRWGPSI